MHEMKTNLKAKKKNVEGEIIVKQYQFQFRHT